MPRPKKPRFIASQPSVSAFGPLDAPPSGEVSLSMEGMEALRLTDVEGMDQDTGARLMGVSRQTYGRILGLARGIVAHALTTGKILRVSGGSYEIRGHGGRRRRCRRGRFAEPGNGTDESSGQ